MSARFALGACVRAQAAAREGHTRLPAYLRGRIGSIVALRGRYPLADERARGLRDARVEMVYAVQFSLGDHDVVADLWESYLEGPA
ncbi:MAG: nitrile hydratase subunit beta [bacterium]|nr:nitrile hydratase subunit beta [bacterium]